MQIKGLQKTTLIDYPSKVAAIVFLAGCNFRCPFCYSSELVDPQKIADQPQVSEKEFFDFLESKKDLLDGVVVCGGEPTINDDLPQFLSRIKKMGFLVKLDTNGSNPQMLKQLIEAKLVDYVAMDIKTSKAKYQKMSEAHLDLGNIEKSVQVLKTGNIAHEFRTTVVPGLVDRNDVSLIAEWIGGPDTKYFLQNFRPVKTLNPVFEELEPYNDTYLKELKESIKPFFKSCQIRNYI